jgi:hypothetical protein
MPKLPPTSEQQPIIQTMQGLINEWETRDDARLIFLSCYRLMTANVLAAIEEQEFHDPVWATELLHRFASYYFDALAVYERGEKGTPRVWQVAFDEARTGRRQPLQLLLLGVNAHINYDLVLTLVDLLCPEWAALSADDRVQRYEDHCHVNDVIGRTIDEVQDLILEPVSPGLEVVDSAFGPVDEWLTSRLLSKWREEVWRNAVRWIEAHDTRHRTQLQHAIESKTLQRAEAILLDDWEQVFRYLF